MDSKIEYRVRPVTRHIVTRYSESLDGTGGGSSVIGEYDNEEMAYEVGYAVCKTEHDRLGLPLGSDLIKYPGRGTATNCVAVTRTGTVAANRAIPPPDR